MALPVKGYEIFTALARCELPNALSFARQLSVSDEKALRSALRLCRLLATEESFQWADELPFARKTEEKLRKVFLSLLKSS